MQIGWFIFDYLKLLLNGAYCSTDPPFFFGNYLVFLLHSSVASIPMVKLQKAITTLKYAIMG
ncbi:hypothetical protein AGA26_07540 [Escherichia coli]|nr:hypothetical protein I3W_01210 [Escherichia coli O43 str. RM10042]KLH24450.1 hypothetical protein WR13_05960 [Escherichia coli]KNY76891.1 hypothetical protein AGA26_07540 [Escherichia coli]GDP14801.1 hypothetical protein BvCmsNSP067_01104 [Escherichia coli]